MHSTTRRGILDDGGCVRRGGIALAGAAPAIAAGRTLAAGSSMHVIDCDFAFLADPVLFKRRPRHGGVDRDRWLHPP